MVFEEANLTHLTLRKTDFAHLSVKFSQLLNGFFQESKISTSVFSDTSFIGFRGERVLFDGCAFRKCDFRHAQFTEAEFRDCAFEASDFSAAHFKDAAWTSCRFMDCTGQPKTCAEANPSGGEK